MVATAAADSSQTSAISARLSSPAATRARSTAPRFATRRPRDVPALTGPTFLAPQYKEQRKR
ncbi:hypothetical protein AFE02nite_30800 [Actinotalea fermentans]|uniref:Uncharacterized protein n=1 Tax=Actinotalea fermentans TaxID=43671 RepID=A0A511Z1U3_9CELL|nr:hypothetical protein AFE02nite_30800 [Actinotalea fermentans]